MAIPDAIGDREKAKFKESTAVPGLGGVAVVNPDGSSINPSSGVTTATLTNVADNSVSATLVAAATTRKGLIIFNDSTVALYIKYGATASTTSFTYKIPAGGTWEMTTYIWTGIVDGIWDSNQSGSARITELT